MNLNTFKQMGVDRAASASHKEGFVFPPSIQGDLFNYLESDQQELIKPVLRVLKRPYQEKLCIALIDYMETGIADVPEEFQLGAFFLYLTGHNMPEQEGRKGLIRPLHHTEPKSIGTILKQLKPLNH